MTLLGILLYATAINVISCEWSKAHRRDGLYPSQRRLGAERLSNLYLHLYIQLRIDLVSLRF